MGNEPEATGLVEREFSVVEDSYIALNLALLADQDEKNRVVTRVTDVSQTTETVVDKDIEVAIAGNNERSDIVVVCNGDMPEGRL